MAGNGGGGRPCHPSSVKVTRSIQTSLAEVELVNLDPYPLTLGRHLTP